jgi:hypothetical protein
MDISSVSYAGRCTWPSGISYERSHSLDDAAFFISASKSCRSIGLSDVRALPMCAPGRDLRHIAQLLLDVPRNLLLR